jgi:type II secretory pathway pseudopilin PulG
MKNSGNGFGLIEVMISVGLMSGLAYFMMNQSEQSSKIQSKMNFNNDLSSATNHLQTILSKKDNCTLTLLDKQVGDEITQINFGVPDPVISTNPPIPDPNKLPITKGTVLGSSTLQIKEMFLISKTDPVTGVVVGDAVRVTFRAGRTGSNGVFIPIKTVGASEYKKDFLVNGSKDAVTNKYINCFSETGNVVETAVEESCASLGVNAVWNSVDKKCELAGIPLYRNSLTGKIDTQTQPSYTNQSFNCSNCGGNCNACPAGWTQLSNSCHMSSNCGLHRWRNCTTSCRHFDGDWVLIGKMISPPP